MPASLRPPPVWRHGWRACRPQRVGAQFARGALHAPGLVRCFLALPHIPLADTTATGFAPPIFIMVWPAALAAVR